MHPPCTPALSIASPSLPPEWSWGGGRGRGAASNGGSISALRPPVLQRPPFPLQIWDSKHLQIRASGTLPETANLLASFDKLKSGSRLLTSFSEQSSSLLPELLKIGLSKTSVWRSLVLQSLASAPQPNAGETICVESTSKFRLGQCWLWSETKKRLRPIFEASWSCVDKNNKKDELPGQLLRKTEEHRDFYVDLLIKETNKKWAIKTVAEKYWELLWLLWTSWKESKKMSYQGSYELMVGNPAAFQSIQGNMLKR